MSAPFPRLRIEFLINYSCYYQCTFIALDV